jgi:hypothetical protein
VLSTPRRGPVTVPDNAAISVAKSESALGEMFRNLVSAVFNDAALFDSSLVRGSSSNELALSMQPALLRVLCEKTHPEIVAQRTCVCTRSLQHLSTVAALAVRGLRELTEADVPEDIVDRLVAEFRRVRRLPAIDAADDSAVAMTLKQIGRSAAGASAWVAFASDRDAPAVNVVDVRAFNKGVPVGGDGGIDASKQTHVLHVVRALSRTDAGLAIMKASPALLDDLVSVLCVGATEAREVALEVGAPTRPATCAHKHMCCASWHVPVSLLSCPRTARARTHTHTRARARTRAHTHTHTHTHAHTRACRSLTRCSRGSNQVFLMAPSRRAPSPKPRAPS